jgi:hypothetical protein
MLEGLSPRQMAAVLEALRSENPGALTDYQLFIGEQEYTGDVISLSVSTDGGADESSPGENMMGQQGSVGISLDAQLSAYLPRSLTGEDVALDLLIADVPIRRFTGRALRPLNGSGGASLIAASAGFFLDKIRLGAVGLEGYDFVDEEPWVVALTMLNAAPYPRGALIDVERITTPKLRRTADEALTEMDFLADGLDVVSTEADMTFRDTFSGGTRGRKNVHNVEFSGSEAVRVFYVGEDLEDFEFEEFSDVFSEVVCYSQDEDGDITVLAREDVPDSGAPEGASLPIEITASPEEADEQAQQRLQDALTELKGRRGSGTATLPYTDALLEDGDVLKFVQPLYGFRSPTIVREIVAEVRAQDLDPVSKTHELTLVGEVVSEGTLG